MRRSPWLESVLPFLYPHGLSSGGFREALPAFAGPGARDRTFARDYGVKYPKAVASLTVDEDRSLADLGYPAERWKHLRTTNPIASTFATVRPVRLREGVTKKAGLRTRAHDGVQAAASRRGALAPYRRRGSSCRSCVRA